MSEKHKVQVAAKIIGSAPPYYRRAGLVLTAHQQEFEVDETQLRILRADTSVIVVGGPELLAKPTATKPADEKDARLQQLAASHDEAVSKAKQLAAENDQLKAQLGALKSKKDK